MKLCRCDPPPLAIAVTRLRSRVFREILCDSRRRLLEFQPNVGE